MKMFKLKGRDRSFLVRAESKEKACVKLRDAIEKENNRLGAGIDYAYLTEEERKAIEDYKKAIAATSDPKMLGIFAHLLQEETEHIGELSEAEGVDKYGAIAVPEMVDDSDVVGESLEQRDNTVTSADNAYMDYENGEVISDEKFCPSQLRDSDRLKKLAYEFASMGNEFDRANSARSRSILSRDDAAKIAKFYQKGLEVFSQLKSEIPKISLEKDGKWRSPSDNDTLKLLEDGNHNLYWTEDSKCRALANKIEELIKEYRMKYYER